MFGLKFLSTISRSGKSYSVELGSPGGLGGQSVACDVQTSALAMRIGSYSEA